MKLIKKTMLIIGALLLLLIIGLTIFVYTFDANRYKPLITEQVAKATGRELIIEGDIGLTLFPWIGLSIEQVSFANAEGFGPEPFASLESVDIKLKVMPLLKQQLNLDKVRLQGLFLSLRQNQDGTNNWADLSQPPQSSTPPEAIKPGPESVPEATPGQALSALFINGVEVKQATVVWQDDRSGVHIRLDQINLETGAIGVNEAIPVDFSAQASLNQPDLDLKLKLNTQVTVNPDPMAIKLDPLELFLDVRAKTLPAEQIELALLSSLNAGLDQQLYQLGSTRLSMVAKGQSLPGGRLEADLNTSLDVDLAKETANIDKLTLKTLGLELQSQIQLRKLMSQPLAQGQVRLLPVKLKPVLKRLEISLPDMASDQALAHLAMSSEFTASPQMAQLDKLRIEFDRSLIQGGLQARAFAKPDLSFKLNMDQLNLDDYLPRASAETQPVAPAAAGAKAEDVAIDLPTDLLRSLAVDGQFVLQSLQAFGYQIKDISVGLKGRQGRHKLPVSMALLQGSLSLSADLDVRQATPRYQARLNATELQAAPVINPILKDLLGDESMTLEGNLNMSGNLQSRGDSVNRLIAASNGQLDLNLGRAELKGVDAEYFVRKATVDYMEQKRLPVKPEWRGQYNPKQTTAFRVARASAKISNGVVNNQDLLLDSSRLKVTGAGTVDLPRKFVNYRTLVDLNPAHRDSLLEKLLDIPVPVDAKGSFAALDIGMDSSAWGKQVGELIKKETTDKIQQKVDEKVEQKIDKAKDRLKDKFKGLFNR